MGFRYILDVIGVGFATANVTGEIRRPRMAQEREDKEWILSWIRGRAAALPAGRNEDFKEEWPGQRERRNLMRETRAGRGKG